MYSWQRFSPILWTGHFFFVVQKLFNFMFNLSFTATLPSPQETNILIWYEIFWPNSAWHMQCLKGHIPLFYPSGVVELSSNSGCF
jgi:hypothetical protein